jgi:hypothetical protein
MTLYLVLMYLISLALGYVLAFTGATFVIGRSLSDAGTPRGYQDAITPPRFSRFALLLYAASLGGIIYGVWAFGWARGLATAVGLLVAVALNKVLILPKSDGQHFRKLIVHSMINRHADYLKSGDTLRASVMAELLEKLGIPVNEFIAQMRRARDA